MGVELAKGRTVEQITAAMNMVAEGIKAARVVMELAARHGVGMPIAREVHRILYEGRRPEESFRGLLKTRPCTEADAV